MVIQKQKTRKSQVIQDAIKELAELRAKSYAISEDPETAHIRADDVLLEVLRHLGRDDVAGIFEEIKKWYS